jgi:hypothetical protein
MQEVFMPRVRCIELPDLDRLADKRSEVRYGLSGLVPAAIQGAGGCDLDVVMLDVSRGGLGILINGFVPRIGDVLSFCIDGQESIPLSVRWMRRTSLGVGAGLGVTRVGLAVQSPLENLVERLKPFACVDQ